MKNTIFDELYDLKIKVNNQDYTNFIDWLEHKIHIKIDEISIIECEDILNTLKVYHSKILDSDIIRNKKLFILKSINSYISFYNDVLMDIIYKNL